MDFLLCFPSLGIIVLNYCVDCFEKYYLKYCVWFFDCFKGDSKSNPYYSLLARSRGLVCYLKFILWPIFNNLETPDNLQIWIPLKTVWSHSGHIPA